MLGKCKMTGKEKELPCSAAGCPLFGDCIVEYEKAVRKPQTNADRIRAMSDMELRDFLQSRVWLCETHKLCDGCPLYSEEKGCLSTLEWLQQPAEE